MSKKFIQLTSGWIPVSVLLMFVVALVTGQARANLPSEIKATPAPMVTTSINVVLHSQMFEKLETLPLVIDTLLALPAEIELSIDATIRSTDDDSAHTPSF